MINLHFFFLIKKKTKSVRGGVSGELVQQKQNLHTKTERLLSNLQILVKFNLSIHVCVDFSENFVKLLTRNLLLTMLL
jgi:hypothetical protein